MSWSKPRHSLPSSLQIETIVYACQRHLHHLQNDARAGFFIGDGAGVGKGRTIAGLIWENWHHHRWVSVGSDLKFDAHRDLDDVGATCVEVHALNKLPYSKLDSRAVGIKEGVVFLTYSSLIASSEKGRSRLQQLVQWCGSGFDGLVVFDECHKAKNLVPEAGGQATRTGEAVLELQAKLPEARVVYCSATGASEPRNLGYMVRLGLWGAGTRFSKFHDFLGALEKGGVGALELVAMDMKARGMYVCRTLSYEGAEFEVVEAPLEEKMTVAIKSAEKESESRATSEKLQASLSEVLERNTQELERRNNNLIKVLQEYNASLQQYNSYLQTNASKNGESISRLQANASKNGESISRLEKEKSLMEESLAGLRDYSNLLKNQLDSSMSSQQKAVKHEEELKNEVGRLRSNLQQVRNDRDHLLAQVKILTVKNSNHEELAGKTVKDLDILLTATTALEELCSSQRELIKVLEHQPAAANEKLKSADLVAMETMTENGLKNMIKALQNRIADSEIQRI